MGLGEPCFDKLEAMLAHAMLSIPATKGYATLANEANRTDLKLGLDSKEQNCMEVSIMILI